MRDRLIELLEKGNEIFMNGEGEHSDLLEQLADHLLAAGVIVPPCKVGDTVWIPSEYYDGADPITITQLVFCEDEPILYSGGGLEWYYEEIGKTVFLTREEAERALERREG